MKIYEKLRETLTDEHKYRLLALPDKAEERVVLRTNILWRLRLSRAYAELSDIFAGGALSLRAVEVPPSNQRVYVSFTSGSLGSGAVLSLCLFDEPPVVEIAYYAGMGASPSSSSDEVDPLWANLQVVTRDWLFSKYRP